MARRGLRPVPHLVLSGLAFKTPEFDPNRAYSGCCICGRIAQVQDPMIPEQLAQPMRAKWTLQHQKAHSDTEHRQLLESGRKYTPEAAQELATRGLISMIDIVMDDEVASAYAEGARYPKLAVDLL